MTIKMLKRYVMASLLLCVILSPAAAESPANETSPPTEKTLTYQGKRFRALVVNPAQVALHWKDAQGKPYGYFSSLKKILEKQREVVVLMNAGIYASNDTPAGLHVEKGEVLKSLNRRRGKGNFHLQPNGVFLIDKDNNAHIVTTGAYQQRYAGREQSLRLATQSGPMLLIHGKINAKFLPKSQSFYARNGVCTTPKGELYFVATAYMSSNFYQFAQAIKQLGCDNALYLDGNISKLYVKGENSTFHFVPFVGILSVTTPAP